MNALDTTQLREETLRWIFSIVGAVLIYTAVALIISASYHPDIEALKSVANEILAEPRGARPEPVEALLFRLGVVIIGSGIIVFYSLFSKLKLISALAKKPLFLAVSALCIAFILAIIWFDFAALNPFGPDAGDVVQNNRDKISSTNFDFYFNGIFLGGYLWLYTLIIVPAITCMFFIGIKKRDWENKKAFNTVSALLGYALVLGGIVIIGLINTMSFPYSNENKYDFGAVYYSMTQVYAGVPMLVDHFTNTYGLYPHFLNPLFKVIGLNVFKCSLVLSLLTALSFLLNFYFLKQFVRNKIILFLGFATVLFFPYLDFLITTSFDSLFSCYPIRYIIPSTLTCLAAIYLRNASQKIYWTTFFVSAAFILWNPEMGIVCYLSWIAVNVYNDYYNFTGQVNMKKILSHVLAGIGVVLVTFLCYELLIFIFYRAWADLGSLFKTIFVFGKYGLGLLPMVLVHPWNLMALIIILGFTYAIIDWRKKQVTPRSSLIFLVSLIALGYFVYFQGRSQDSNFSYSSGFCLILLTMLGDELWQTVKKNNVLLLNALFIIFLFIISFSFAEIIYDAPKMADLVYQEDDKNKQASVQQFIEGNIDFILQNSKEHEKILVLAQRKTQSLFFGGYKRVSAFNPGMIDLMLRSDLTRLENTLADSSYDIFIEPGDNLKYPFLARSLSEIAASYYLKDAEKAIALLKRRKKMIPPQRFFFDTSQLIFHRKYYDDPSGVDQRINDALGMDHRALMPQFSVQLLFYTLPQSYPNATLIGNLKPGDQNGFAVFSMFSSSKFYFGVNGKWLPTEIPYHKWVYCVMNVYPDHFDVYRNGDLTLTQQLPGPMTDQGNKLFVGNLGNFEYYIGPISEVLVTNRTLDSGQIKATWQDIRQATNQ